MSNTCIKLLITTVILNLVSSYRDDGYKYGVKYNLNERKTKQNKGEIWQLSDQYNITNTHVRDSNKGTEIYDGYKGGNMIKGDYSIVPGNADGGEDEGDCRRGGGFMMKSGIVRGIVRGILRGVVRGIIHAIYGRVLK